MRRAWLLLLACCGNDKPPLLNPEAGRVIYDATVLPIREGGVADAGSTDGAATNAIYFDMEGTCPTGYSPVWRFFDFKTKTPGDTALSFSAQTASAIGEFVTAPSVHLGTVTGPDVTVWTGIDVEPKLKTIGEKSLHYLRVTVVFQTGTAGAPTLVDARQQYDCILSQ